ncbi:MAG: Vi polysaccharide biosynthesis protein vipB/tviC [Candidatus Syntrophoarchaeum caldarius]|uniref:Vi polysaccharide biosynthesis protein vipB/tviC n=1 Tax=Candidatus Syntropharchaeum caldarium TaxID=1838285 RepID=A0A1F2PCB2_9EURY|nr:MAG: Vi polysaccharide biosynthesis protein vipB/tviC [Candidatus Syntrophoarchaeum caldarius]
MKFVVTGGAGFIGSNLAEELAEMGEVTIIDDLSSGRLENISDLLDKNNVNFIRESIANLTSLKAHFADADCVFHQAAIASVQRSVEDPLLIDEVNARGTLNVLIAARDCGVKKVICASSSAVYGDSPELPKREDMSPCPLSPYAVSKLTGEYYCKVFSEIYGIDTVSLRYFNVYGPRQDPSSEYAAVIPKFIKILLKKEPPVIFGDGTQTRDFVFVEDVVRANILAMKHGNVRGVFNVAGGKKITINELLNTIMEVVGIELDPIHTEPRAGDIKDSVADISLAKNVLGYEPAFDLKEGLSRTINWLRE